MSDYELQTLATGTFYDEHIQAAEQEDSEVLSPDVPGNRLDEVIHNPIDGGTD